MAAASAAGLNRNGIRRTAFSTGDLQALSAMPNRGTPSPPDPQNLNIHRCRNMLCCAQHQQHSVCYSRKHGESVCCLVIVATDIKQCM